MPKASPVQNNFTAGELSPWLYGRFDVAKYPNAAKTLENILIHQAGGGQRRPGTKYVAEVKTSTDGKCRLVTFEFSTTQTYILEFGDKYIRFYRNRGQIQIPPGAYELATDYETADLFDLQFAQDADTMWIVHPDFKPRKLTRTDHNAWTLIDYRPELLTLDVAPATIWAAGDTIRGVSSGKTCVVIEALTTTTYNVKDRTGTFTDGEELTNETDAANQGAGYPTFTLDPFGEDASDDCPSCVAMFEQRILFANTNNDSQKIWGSVSGYFDNMTVGTNAGDAFVYVIASDKVNAIRWLKPIGKSLQMGTLGSTFSLSSGGEATAVTPTNVSVKRDTTYGAANILPETIGSFIYYVDRDLNHLRELGFSFDLDAQQALDMTILSDHIAKAADPLDSDGFTQIAYQQSPVSRLWCVRNDGQLAVLTRQIDQEVIGWSRQISGSDSRDSGIVESVAVIPTDEGDDEVWVIVKRYINGSTVRYVEYFMPEKFDHQQDIFFVDSGLSLDSPKTITDISAKTIIDDMEYASDGAAQNAYVSSDTAGTADQQQTVGTLSSLLGDATVEHRVGQSFILSNNLTVTAAEVKRSTVTTGNPTGNWTIKIETDVAGKPSGTLVNPNASIVVIPPAEGVVIKGTFPGAFKLSAATTYWLVVDCDDQDQDVGWTLVIASAAESVYADGHGYKQIDGVWNDPLVNQDFYFKIYTQALQCYSEGTIKEQGNHSLKVEAMQTASLNDTLTKTLTGTDKIDLTDIDTIKMEVRASRTGNNFRIGFHDSGGTTTWHTVNIAAVDTWQVETIDISTVDNGNKDDIDSIIITILDADDDNIFYIDNIYAVAAYIIVTATSHGFATDDRVRIVDVIGKAEVNNRNFVIQKLSGSDTFALKDEGGSYIDGSTYTAYISGGEARKMVTSITGLTHLVGEDVAITADGLAVPSKIVSAAGGITLDARASLVHAGLPYISDIGLLPQTEGSATGMAVGKTQRIYKLIIQLYRSLNFEFGPNADNLDTLEQATLFTGNKVPNFHGDWSREGLVLLRQSQPLPMNILSVTIVTEVVDD